MHSVRVGAAWEYCRGSRSYSLLHISSGCTQKEAPDSRSLWLSVEPVPVCRSFQRGPLGPLRQDSAHSGSTGCAPPRPPRTCRQQLHGLLHCQPPQSRYHLPLTGVSASPTSCVPASSLVSISAARVDCPSPLTKTLQRPPTAIKTKFQLLSWWTAPCWV